MSALAKYMKKKGMDMDPQDFISKKSNTPHDIKEHDIEAGGWHHKNPLIEQEDSHGGMGEEEGEEDDPEDIHDAHQSLDHEQGVHGTEHPGHDEFAEYKLPKEGEEGPHDWKREKKKGKGY